MVCYRILSQTGAVLTTIFFLAATYSAFGQKATADQFVKNELLVKFAAASRTAERAEANRSIGSEAIGTFGDLGWHRVRLSDGISVERALKHYKSSKGVIAAQPNYYYRLAVSPNDPLFVSGSLYALERISAQSAWDLTTGSDEVVVANIDTGIRYTHEDLAPNMWTNPGEIPGNGVDDDNNGFVDDFYGWDFFFNDPDPIDENGHGTHTAGTIGAVGNNLLGVVGVNWNVRIMTIKIYDGIGLGTTSAVLINAYNYIRMMKQRGINIRATNNSYGGCDEACGFDQATKDAIDALGDADILNVFAAGNAGVNTDEAPFFPASYNSPSILSVGGATQTDTRIYNFGPNNVDLAAPAVGIQSTKFVTDSSYGALSGTSMATPHTTGAAALLAAHNPDLSAASIKATLMNTVDKLPAFDGFVRSNGRLNVDRALRNETVCSVVLPDSDLRVQTKGGVFKLRYDLAPNCELTVNSDVRWIHLMGGREISGAGEISFRVMLNSVMSRSGTLRVGDRSITISQIRGT